MSNPDENQKKKNDNDHFNALREMFNKINPFKSAPEEPVLQNESNEKKKDSTEEQNFTLSTPKKKDKEEIDIDYERWSGHKPQNQNGGTIYTFNSDKDALDFFKGQADKGRAFQVYKGGEDSCMYSDGKCFVRGTKAEVEAYKKNPNDFNTGENGDLTKKDPGIQNKASSQSQIAQVQSISPKMEVPSPSPAPKPSQISQEESSKPVQRADDENNESGLTLGTPAPSSPQIELKEVPIEQKSVVNNDNELSLDSQVSPTI